MPRHRVPVLRVEWGARELAVEGFPWVVGVVDLVGVEEKEEGVCEALKAEEKLNGEWVRIPHTEHRKFHLTVFCRLDNPFVLGLLEAYWDAYDAVQLNSYAEYDYLKTVWAYHRRILEAICADDYSTALELFVEHTKLLRTQPRMRDMKGDINEPTSEVEPSE